MERPFASYLQMERSSACIRVGVHRGLRLVPGLWIEMTDIGRGDYRGLRLVPGLLIELTEVDRVRMFEIGIARSYRNL